MYKPLPDKVTIKESSIEGLGIFATEDIEEGYVFGISHIYDSRFENEYSRTPMGGFVNHSEKPNCELISADENKTLVLVANRKISIGEEITTKYSLYNFG